METVDKFEVAFSEKNNWQILSKVHQEIFSLGADISFLIYPIYIKYFQGDKVIAVVFFKSGGSHMDILEKDQIDLGLNISTKPKIIGFRTAEYMKDRNVSYSILLKNSDSLKTISGVIRLLAE
jgi:hypothetical protein